MSENIKKILSILSNGDLTLLIDDTGSQSSGYALCSAHTVDAERVGFMAHHCRGFVLAGISQQRAKELMLQPLPSNSINSIDFAASVEARQGVTTGISAADRAQTLRTLANTSNPRSDLMTPGHILTAQSLSGGVLVRASVIEAACDLMTLAALPPVAALCQCLDEKGNPLSGDELTKFAKEHSLQSVSLTEVIYQRLSSEKIIERISRAKLPIRAVDEFEAIGYRSKLDGAEHFVLVKGDLSELDEKKQQKPIYTRVQAEQPLGDLLGLEFGSSRSRLTKSLEKIKQQGRGIFVYIRHPGKGRLAKQIDTLEQSKSTPMTKAAQLREYGVGAQILKDLDAKRLILITDSTREIPGIDAFDIEIVGREPLSDATKEKE